MDSNAFKKIYITILKLGLVPWTAECLLCAALSYYFFEMPLLWAFALGSIIAAVSPAVIVPCLFRLRSKGYGVSKGKVPSKEGMSRRPFLTKFISDKMYFGKNVFRKFVLSNKLYFRSYFLKYIVKIDPEPGLSRVSGSDRSFGCLSGF